MTDIGFGLVDRRTVIVVLFSMVLAQVLLGYKIPIDTSSAGQAFVDLVVLTGYLYFARSICRMPIAVIAALLIIKEFVLEEITQWPKDHLEKLESKADKIYFKKFKKFGLHVILYAGTPLAVLIGLLALVISFGSWIEVLKPLSEIKGKYRSLAIIIGTLDRLGLIFISVFATMPSMRFVVSAIGIIGLILMTAIFTVRGDFTSLVKDYIEEVGDDDNIRAIVRKGLKKRQSLSPPGSPQPTVGP